MNVLPPSPDQQVTFLRNIQRLLSEGLFTSTYKLALLLAINDLCVSIVDDVAGELTLDVGDISAKFVELYWRQCRPFEFAGQTDGIILLQNKGKQAAIIRKISSAQQDFGGSLFRLKKTAPDLWSSLASGVQRTVRFLDTRAGGFYQ